MTARESFTCPRCGATSWNTNDALYGYCGRCHDWTGDDVGGGGDERAPAQVPTTHDAPTPDRFADVPIKEDRRREA